MGLFSKGIMLTQYKEPALSNKLANFTNPQPVYFTPSREIPRQVEAILPQDIITLAREGNIYDERDGRLLATKLRKAQNVAKVIIVDAIDDEPYVSSKLGPLLQLTDEVLLGISLCQKITKAIDVSIQVYRHSGELHTVIPSKIGGYRVEKIRGGYPALPSTSVGSGKRSQHQLTVGVGALIHLARVFQENRPQTTTFVTVAGNCIANPMNLEVSLGMNFTEIIERCGLKQEPNRIISGGPMTGIAVINGDNTVVTPTTRAILAVRGEISSRTYSCIGCGRCEEFCPVGLNPKSIHNFMEQKYYPQLELFDPQYCIECGTCSYTCPSHIDLLGDMIKAKKYALTHFVTEEEEEMEEDTVDI